MSLLVVGLSHRSAPLELLERVALDGRRSRELAAGVVGLDDVSESLVLTTCNRTEVYAEALSFHGAVAQVGDSLAKATGVDLQDLTPHLYVHYEERAVDHLFSLACGMESMALGESEILGQLRDALRAGQEDAHLGTVLNPLFQQALRVGKRAHTDTGLDRVARSLVGAGLTRAAAVLGSLDGADALVVGAGAMSGLAAASLSRAGVGTLGILNRTRERAERLAEAHQGQVHDWSQLERGLATADLVLTCTGATDHVVTRDLLPDDRTERPLVIIDLAMPRDVAPEAAEVPGVTVWGLADLNGDGADGTATAEAGGGPDETEQVLAVVRELVAGEVAAYLATRRSARVGPTLAMLRSRAAAVADGELERLDQRLPDLSDAQRAEVQQSVRRILDKLLHTPTVRAKQLAAHDADGSSVALLRELFDLDARETAAVTTPPQVSGLP
ncbi:glutamyl-tRNA reductase [Ornithinimicrobium murale]|uniref:glutamyl-tRNA reductase n=1 Tax=Ornithinimicrobium murale TaxID=1050153 RepID=UPI000E0D3828|nr:glutamyl-tRNA reductase [Ornithinimicrobium murale]